MAARLGPGVAVLVIGPTVGGGRQAIGQDATVAHWIRRGEPFAPSGWGARSDGWAVDLSRPVRWSPSYSSARGIFPATSLMLLDGEAEREAITAAEPAAVEA